MAFIMCSAIKKSQRAVILQPFDFKRIRDSSYFSYFSCILKREDIIIPQPILERKIAAGNPKNGIKEIIANSPAPIKKL
jgi:hypothetical protein